MQIKRTGASDYGRYTKALICGEPGSGKTLISSTWPNPFYASAEGGLMSIADRNIPYVEVKTIDDLLKIKNMLDQDADVREEIIGFPVDTIVIDTIDEVQQIMMRERLRDERIEAMRLADWGWLSENMSAMVRGFRNLDMNVVFTCHVKETSDAESGKTWIKPQLQGAIGDKIAGYVDFAMLLKSSLRSEVVNGEAKRVLSRELQTFPDPMHPWLKDRSGKLPELFPVNFEDDYERIHGFVFANVDALPEGEVTETADVEAATLDEVDAIENPEPEPAPEPVNEPEPAPAPEPAKEEEPLLVNEDMTTPEPESEAAPAVTADGEIAPRNKLPEGVEPINKGYGTNIYCTECGGEVEDEERADLSRIRHRRILDLECFNKRSR